MDAVLHALSDSSRRTVLEALRYGEATAGELAALLPIARPGVSWHLRVLREAGLVEVRQEAQQRVYSLRPEPLAEVDDWLGVLPIPVGSAFGCPAHRSRSGKETTKEHQMTVNRTGGSDNLLGSLRMLHGKAMVRLEDRYSTDIEDLWSAITDPPRLARWIADVEGDLRVGGEFHASFVSGPEGPGRVDVCEPPRRLLVTMHLGEDAETVFEAWLAAEGDHTRLIVEERGLPPDEAASHGAGWQVHFEDLAAHLAGRDRADWEMRWLELTPAYQEQAAGRLLGLGEV